MASLTLPLAAQFEFGVGAAPGDYYRMRETSAPVKAKPDPFATALTNELLATKTSDYFDRIGISTQDPAMDLGMYARRGFGRTELITLLLISENSKEPLKELAKKRARGARLREIASQFHLSYEDIRSKALVLKNALLEKIPANLDNTSHGSENAEPSTGTTPSQRTP